MDEWTILFSHKMNHLDHSFVQLSWFPWCWLWERPDQWIVIFLDKQFKCFRCQSSGCIYSLFSLLRFHHLLRFEAMGQGVFKCASIGRFSLLLSFINCLNCFGISKIHKWVNRSVHLHPLKRAPWFYAMDYILGLNRYKWI